MICRHGAPCTLKHILSTTMTHRLWFINYDSEIHFELFVQFAETGSCDSYDQYSNDRNDCNINQLPPKPEIINDYQGMTHISWLMISSFSVLKTDYENYTLVVSCQNIDESSHREVIYMLNRNTCWPYQNKGKCDTTVFTNSSNRSSFFNFSFILVSF